MTRRASILFKTGWISLAIIGVAILVFGLIATAVPTPSGPPYLKAISVASIGMRLFGLLITTIAYRRRQRWAWFALWYYPVFWTAHLVGGLPPGKDHVHQIVFIALSITGLLLPVREFFPRRRHDASHHCPALSIARRTSVNFFVGEGRRIHLLGTWVNSCPLRCACSLLLLDYQLPYVQPTDL